MSAELQSKQAQQGKLLPSTLSSTFRKVLFGGHIRNTRQDQASEPVRIPRARTVLAYRDQDSHCKAKLSGASSECCVLLSRQYSLFGYPADLTARFELQEELGKGGNAVVRTAHCKLTGKDFACKSIAKVLEGPQFSEQKKKGHLEAVRMEIDVLRKLRGSLNVATLEDVYEDDKHVHIILELCTGGELVHRIGDKHYSERTAASYMRAVLRTLAQCHSHHILHRDIKPGNFLLLDDDERAPLKAIDFGLAVPFHPEQLPRSDLGLEGTPWYMAPEVLSSAVGPQSDVWSAGVMAAQLLTGRLPFDDKRHPMNPSVTKIWQSILCDKLDFKKSYWEGISEKAKDFVRTLLEKDPAKRPSAKQALRHPWIQGHSGERCTGKQLSLSVVQRIQRFGQGSLLKRTVLEHIAEDMLSARRESSATASSCPITTGSTPVLTGPEDPPLTFLFSALKYGDSDRLDRQQLLSGLRRLGYKLEGREADALLDQLDSEHTGTVQRSHLAASQMDWRALQERQVQTWLQAARHTFADLDRDGDGIWSTDDILSCLQSKLVPSEVEPALVQAMREACKRDESQHLGLDFDAFLRMLRSDSRDSLDQYDDRMGSSVERLNLLLERSCRAGDHYTVSSSLETVSEVL